MNSKTLSSTGTALGSGQLPRSSDLQSEQNLFAIPVLNHFLLYAPLSGLAALVNGVALLHLRDGIIDGPLSELMEALRANVRPAPRPIQGEFVPHFLGLLPTRDCNLACRYCGFQIAGGHHHASMPLTLARDAVTWYMDQVRQSGSRQAEVHFFGGEAFCAEEVLDFSVPLSRQLALDAGISVKFEVATNGAFSEERCRWAADHLDTVVLSLDGPADVQDLNRPYRGGRGSFQTVTRSATILSAGSADLYLRSCVTAQTADRLPEIADWFCQAFHPAGVCFESLQPTPQSEAAGLQPPDPLPFARGFIKAARLLASHDVEPIYTAADIRALRVSFCPVGQDVAIVSPDGVINACYLLQSEWEAKGLDLRLGRMSNRAACLDEGAVQAARDLNVWNKPHCERCFCKWHCAGGCHVNHQPADPTGAHARLCVQTRIIAVWNILNSLGRADLAEEWLADDEAVNRTEARPSDLLMDVV